VTDNGKQTPAVVRRRAVRALLRLGIIMLASGAQAARVRTRDP
jgi:hypothetical protein